jgi:hypothetical protein
MGLSKQFFVEIEEGLLQDFVLFNCAQSLHSFVVDLLLLHDASAVLLLLIEDLHG